jgi:uncharacterized membrane protein (UPF0127 family)
LGFRLISAGLGRTLAGVAGAVLALVLASAPASACRPDRIELRGDFGVARFRVDVADTPAKRAQGLMHVAQMPRMTGMLFVYDRPEPVRFWMKNTLIPLDMIFADETGTVQRIHANAIPQDLTPIPGGDAIQYVLEINGGLAADFGFAPGDVMRHPAIAQDRAAWPCSPP